LQGGNPATPAAETKPDSQSTAGKASQTFELISVPDISVETSVGFMPKLPRTTAGVYRDAAKGPNVRIIWPSPKDNQMVLQPGTLSITGRVAGTSLRPVANVTVKASAAPASAPERLLQEFPLDRVTLNPDEQQRATPFIRHRDKFLKGLSASDPDR